MISTLREKMLELKNLHYHPSTSEVPILSGVNLKAGDGQLVVIFGPSGSGKTTLVEIISGLNSNQKGQITWFKEDLKARKRRLLSGVVFQFPERHFIGLTLDQELRLGHRRLRNEEKMTVLNEVGMSEIDLRIAPEKLSGGQQRRLAIAVQLLRKPNILILDEPTAGLDWSVKDEIIQLLVRLAKNKLLIVVTHEPNLFKGVRTFSYKLNKGKLQSIQN